MNHPPKGIALTVILSSVIALSAFLYFRSATEPTTKSLPSGSILQKTTLIAGGCFWSVERDFDKLVGVIDVKTGYAGGTTDNPTYGNYVKGGHREVVEVTYDPKKVSYSELVEFAIKHSDPTDASGSFFDRGIEYAPAVYFENKVEMAEARRIISQIDGMGIYQKPIVTMVIPMTTFWPAEDYHQDYAKKNPFRYEAYRRSSGRSAFIEKYWGDMEMNINDVIADQSWTTFTKPPDGDLKKSLSQIQYHVTQEEGTEVPFTGEYDSNKAEGIYVDIVSGEPLFSSSDKYDSETGWPSFIKPIDDQAVIEIKEDSLFSPRTEIRSKYADSHLGHVFDDGPVERGGKRYCMNSAALRFIPLSEMAKKGYGKYINAVVR